MAAKVRGVPPLPLSARLPNPPPLWFGRADDLAELASALRRGPLCSVWGPAGVGKSALVRKALHEHFASRVPHAIQVTVDTSGLFPALVHLLGIVCDMRGTRRPSASDREALLATLIDHAEPTGGSGTDEFWIVLEDLHNAHPDHAAELLAALARHARVSRWIAVGRERLESEEARGQSLALGPMSEPELRELAAALAPEASALVQQAAGLPGRLIQLSTGESPADPLRDEDEAARRLVESLSLVNALVPAPVLARRCADVDLGRLLRRGWLTRDSRGVGVHAPMRGLVLAGLSDAARQRAGTDAAGLLGAVDDDPTATLEALGLLLERGDVSSAAGLLEQRTDALLAAGKATELWARLEPVRAPQLASIRLRVAVAVGSGAALGSVTLPADPTPGDRERYARALLRVGKLADAERAALDAEQAAREAGDDALAFDAGRLRVRVALDQADDLRAQALLRALTPATHEQRLSRDVDLAASLVQSGLIEDAMAIAREVEAQLPAPQDAPEQARFGVAWVLYVVGDLDRARRVLATLGTPSAHSSGGALPSRVLLLRGALALDGGDIELVRASCEQLDAIAHSNFERTYTRIQRLLVELASGRYEAVLDGVDEMLAAARDLERVDLEVAIETARVRALAELAEPPDPTSGADEQSTSRLEDMFALAVLHHRLLWDADAPAPTLALPAHPEIAATAHLTEATRFLAAGKAALAAEPAQAGAALARQAGYRVVEADATSLLREARFVAGHLDDWRSLVHRKPAVELPSHADLSRVELAVTGDDGFDLGALDLLAHTATERARRRAAALLGEEARLDLRDAAFVEAARAIAGCHVHHRASNPAEGQASGPALDLDPRRRLVWVSRRRIAFARRPLLWMILDLLATSPAPVDKERLLREAWSVDVYHPLRHDARVHTAISALRKALGEDSGAPIVVGSTEGYSIGPTWRVRRLSPAE